MSVTIIVGGQYGSEGKGKVSAKIIADMGNPYAVRCGGPNAGHTTLVDGKDVILRQVPAGVSNPNTTMLMSAGCVIDEDILIREADMLGLSKQRLIIDPRACLVKPEDKAAELEIYDRISSTGSGNGAALIKRMERKSINCLAGSSERLRDRFLVSKVADRVNDHIDRGGDVVVEGTQGYGLSLIHGPHYPYVTARDTTASGFASEVGIAPSRVTEVIMAIRTFPIRVGGNSGPLENETTWEGVKEASGAPEVVPELTSVTRRLRRVGWFNEDRYLEALRVNRPSFIAVMGMDRLDYADTGVNKFTKLSVKSQRFWKHLTDISYVSGIGGVKWFGTGPGTAELYDIAEDYA